MKIPFTDKEVLTIPGDRDRFLRTIGNHTDADDKAFEKLFVGQANKNGFQVVRVKKFGFWDYCVTVMSGHIVDEKDKIELTYRLRWWYAIELPVVILFFAMFVTFAAASENTHTNDILIVGGMGIIGVTWTFLRCRRRFGTDKEKYRRILNQLIVRSNVR
jgi:hypothetical protein